MNYGPLIFLAAFFALATSWFSFVLGPQVQVGHMQPTNTIPDNAIYPLGRAGLAQQGRDVYRANGCATCHSQQVRQQGVICELVLTEPGTNEAAVVKALLKLDDKRTETDAQSIIANLPKTLKSSNNRDDVDRAKKLLDTAGAKSEIWIVPVGPDIARGWGKRRNVAEDFLYDYPVMPGSQRVGPDLANVGLHLPDASWHLRHLYAPRVEVAGSPMPPYRYLFEKRKISGSRSAEALQFQTPGIVEEGFEVVPKQEAKALVAYLASLQAGAAIFSAPLTVPPAPAPPSTNAVAGGTNAAPTNTPAK